MVTGSVMTPLKPSSATTVRRTPPLTRDTVTCATPRTLVAASTGTLTFASAGTSVSTRLDGAVPTVVLGVGGVGAGPASTFRLRVTSAAGSHVASPPWLAVTRQVPTESRVTTAPRTVQTVGVAVVYDTGRSDDAVAASTGPGRSTRVSESDGNVMACARSAAGSTWSSAIASSAGSHRPSPDCWASTVQVPAAVSRGAAPVTVQTAGVRLR